LARSALRAQEWNRTLAADRRAPDPRLTVEPLTPVFAARVTGVDISQPVDDAVFAEIRGAFDSYSVLVFPGQPLTDEQQIAFSERFGPLEGTRGVNPASGTVFARQSNLDIKTGETIPADPN